MNVLIAGCNGLLGQNLIDAAPADVGLHGVGIDLTPIVKSRLQYRRIDITDAPALHAVIHELKPDFILNAAAMTDVDGCERNPDLCNRLNRDAVKFMAETGVPLVHVSTDYVFDGEHGPYHETDATKPLSHYGQSKLESEALALAFSKHSIVLRTLWLWGLTPGGKKSFTDFVVENLRAQKPVRIVDDQIGNPTLALDLALAIWALIEKQSGGIYHVAGADRMSRLDWALTAAEFYGLDKTLVHPAKTSDLKQPAKRPLNSGLICQKLMQATGFAARGLRAQIAWVHEQTQQRGH